MVFYTYNKHIGIIECFQDYIKKDFPLCSGVTASPDDVMLEFAEGLSESNSMSLSNLVSSYVDPPFWLMLDHTENTFMHSHITSSAEPTLLESFIMSPYNDPNTVLGDIKTIVTLTQGPTTCDHFSSWDSNVNPVSVNVSVYSQTCDTTLVANSVNMNDMIATKWIPLLQAGSNVLPPLSKTLQIYGFKDRTPTFDCIWQFNGSITNSNVMFDLNGLQKLFYQVKLPV